MKDIHISKRSSDCFNPLRAMNKRVVFDLNSTKCPINMTIGDVCLYKNLIHHDSFKQKMLELIETQNFGYFDSTGIEKVRKCLAEYASRYGTNIQSKDVFMSCGASGGLFMCFEVLCEVNDEILIPSVSFPYYEIIVNNLSINYQRYKLKADKDWEIDLEHLESLISKKTKAILINNPSNPCGSVFSRQHIEQVLSTLSKYNIPLVVDEVYEDIVFNGKNFTPFSLVNKNSLVLSVSSLSKKFILPGFRIGWVVVHDPANIGHNVYKGLTNLSCRLFGPGSLSQEIIPFLLKEHNFYTEQIIQICQINSQMFFNKLKDSKVFVPLETSGTIYQLIEINFCHLNNVSEENISEMILKEQNLFCLPTKIFNLSNHLRMILTCPEIIINEVSERLIEFSIKYSI